MQDLQNYLMYSTVYTNIAITEDLKYLTNILFFHFLF